MNPNDWNFVREAFPFPRTTVYLNNGSFGPCPRSVIEETVDHVRRLDTSPGEYFGPLRQKLTEVKERFGRFAGVEPDDFVFVTNVTVGMNMIARGLRGLACGDELLTTDQEYGAVDNTWQFVARRRGLVVRKVSIPQPPRDADEIVDLLTQAMTERTKVLYFSHITTTTGLIMPVQDICAAAREKGIVTAVDGAHAPGMIPLDVEALGCDFYTGNCHKWLCAPKGTGFLYASPDSQKLLDPLIVGWGWSPEEETFIGNFENPGTHSMALPAGVGAAVDFQETIGRERIASRGRELAAYARSTLREIDGIRLITSERPELSCSLSTFLMPPTPDGVFHAELSRRGIIIPAWVNDEGGRFRLSTHMYNMPYEVDLLAEAVRESLERKS